MEDPYSSQYHTSISAEAIALFGRKVERSCEIRHWLANQFGAGEVIDGVVALMVWFH